MLDRTPAVTPAPLWTLHRHLSHRTMWQSACLQTSLARVAFALPRASSSVLLSSAPGSAI